MWHWSNLLPQPFPAFHTCHIPDHSYYFSVVTSVSSSSFLPAVQCGWLIVTGLPETICNPEGFSYICYIYCENRKRGGNGHCFSVLSLQLIKEKTRWLLFFIPVKVTRLQSILEGKQTFLPRASSNLCSPPDWLLWHSTSNTFNNELGFSID